MKADRRRSQRQEKQMKRRLMGVLTAALVAGGFALTGGAATAVQPPDVHHPQCEGLVKDIEPGDPTPVGGIVYVKAGNEHVNIGYKDAGHVATSPNEHGVSHVDVCPSTAPEPKPIVERSFECFDEHVTITTTSYIWLNGGWVSGTPVITTDEPTEAEVAAAVAGCDPEFEYSGWVGEPTCGQNGYVQTRTKTETPYIWDGSQFVAGTPVVTKEERTVPVRKFEPCPTTPTTPTTPTEPTTPTAEVGVLPPTTPPATPPTTGASQVAPAAVLRPAAAPSVSQLPATGSSQWVMAFLAMASLGAGVALTRLSRRSA
jgi:hypothetical protein